ncbi:phycobilisome rod-core linker polypeptide [Calothrix sp. UHCC 0171]|uniref:phycobilisome rod-core linker polypeptide n=1 Tax=Calothrix sp. UHCC 0171 TaxID=3110245 RepID=UPI002B1EE1B2|nr:phycobilisome rod-core linker polypeptide [Calothrix sp. UHCC 0171]MEA5571389.1 phycobilisome rod-core linker polypeptide [Calothrix sp. UHCC 0171]
MASSFVNSTLSRISEFNVGVMEDVTPIELWQGASSDEIEVVIRAAYRQVLGNAHVMESERLKVPESQLRQGDMTVREFVRYVAKSYLYRSKFVDSCYRYRTIELNFKHLLGRAPEDYSEMRYHSQILDEQGFDADIDSYLDCDEYLDNFGENIVPFPRGFQTQNGKKIIGFTNMFQLQRSNSSSDKNLASGNKAQLIRSLLANTPFGTQKYTDVGSLLADLFKPKPKEETVEPTSPDVLFDLNQPLSEQIDEQAKLIEALQKQLAELRPFASIGAAQISTWQSQGAAPSVDLYASLQQQADSQSAQISALEEQIADARRLATIGEARLNKWRSRVFF